MPYIKKERRQELDKEIDELIIKMMNIDSLCKGDLNYICYRLGLSFMRIKGMNYQNISDGIDGLRGASEELKRIIQDPYEDKKILENGSIDS